VRLVTLWGPGGAGKTRLAVETAWELTSLFPGGVWFVSLAGISDPGMVPTALAQTLCLRHVAGKPITVALREHVHLTITLPSLLVIDNVEHLLETAPLFGELLDASENLKVLVTSREVMHVYGEHEFTVETLPTPSVDALPPVSELCRNPAVQLFVQRAAAVHPGFQLNAENSRTVAEICVRLEGLPLALELAAARIRMLSPDAILLRLQNPLDLLTGGSRDVHARQQTLRNAVGWSYDLLHPFEQKLFRRLAVFAGGCTIESAEAVCDARRDLGAPILEGISSLVDKSLLYQRGQFDGDSRFVMLESIREYALERLTESGEEAATRRAHAAYVLVIAEERSARTDPSGISDWVELCNAEQDNIRGALDWLIGTDNGEWALRLGLALFHFWEAREHLAEGRQTLQRILDMKSTADAGSSRARVAFCAATFLASQRDYGGALCLFEDALRIYRGVDDVKGAAAMLTAIGSARRFSGDLQAGRSSLEKALEAYRALHDRARIAGVLSNLADVANAQTDYAAARKLVREAIEIFSELGDAGGRAWSFNRLGDVAYFESDWTEAARLYTEGLNIFRSIGDRWAIARSYADLGHVACEQGGYQLAQSLFVRSLETLQSLGHTRGMARVFEGFACLAVYNRSFARALRLAGVAAGLRYTLGASTRSDEDAFLQRKLHPAWVNLDAARARAEWSRGSSMPLEEAIRFALQQPSDASQFKVTGS
jgi:predicted ATPase